MRGEFMAFLKQYGVIGLAIAVIIGGKANALVTALVDGVLMPIVTFFIPGGAWRTATLDVGSVQDRKSTRLNSSHGYISYAVFCLKKKKKKTNEYNLSVQ